MDSECMVSTMRGQRPIDIVEARLPWVADELTCLSCGFEWQGYRPLGADPKHMDCPRCLQRNTESTIHVF